MVDRGPGRLEDDRDELMTSFAPGGQTLEAVDDFIGALFGGHHTDRKLCGL